MCYIELWRPFCLIYLRFDFAVEIRHFLMSKKGPTSRRSRPHLSREDYELPNPRLRFTGPASERSIPNVVQLHNPRAGESASVRVACPPMVRARSLRSWLGIDGCVVCPVSAARARRLVNLARRADLYRDTGRWHRTGCRPCGAFLQAIESVSQRFGRCCDNLFEIAGKSVAHELDQLVEIAAGLGNGIAVAFRRRGFILQTHFIHVTSIGQVC